jgi:hypothetical protein
MPVYALVGAQLLVGDGGVPEYRLFNKRGLLERIVRWEEAERPVDAREREQFAALREAFLAEHGAEFLSAVPSLGVRSVPRALPYYAAVIVDDAARVWLRQYDTRDAVFPGQRWQESTPFTWLVFDTAGSAIARIEIPSRLSVHVVAGGLVVGTWRGGGDFESVRAYRLRER